MKYLAVLVVAGLGSLLDPMIAFVVLLSLGDAHIELATEVDAAKPEPNTGWAKNLPCLRKDPAPWYWRLLLGIHKPMTGYHAWRIPTLIFLFHLPFFFGLSWSLSSEARILCWFLIYGCFEDYLWFFFHPSYGARKFVSEGRAGKIYWMPVFWGPFPRDYYMALLPIVGLWLLT